MNLKEYIDNLNKLVKRHPEALEYEVIYAEDAEGNHYDGVYYTPTIGFVCDGEFVAETDFEIEHVNYDEPLKSNAVCIN